MLALLLCGLMTDWMSAQEIREAYAAQQEKFRPYAIDECEREIASRKSSLSDASSAAEARRLRNDIKAATTKLNGLKDRTLAPYDRPLWRPAIGFGGILLHSEAKIVKIVDEQSFVMRWTAVSPVAGEPDREVKGLVIRTPSTKLKEFGPVQVKQPLFVVGETFVAGERVYVIAPIPIK